MQQITITDTSYTQWVEQLNIGDEITPQLGEQLPNTICPQPVDKIAEDLFQMPWGHHKLLIDKYKDSPSTALFYVRKTIENGWSRDMLLNMLSTNLPIAISEYDLQQLYPENVDGTIPTIAEIEGAMDKRLIEGADKEY